MAMTRSVFALALSASSMFSMPGIAHAAPIPITEFLMFHTGYQWVYKGKLDLEWWSGRQPVSISERETLTLKLVSRSYSV
jgi:hypothetical protein